MGTETSGLEENAIRYMTETDLDLVVMVEQQSFITPWSKQAFESELFNNNLAHYLVITVGGKVIGYAGMWIILDEAHITNVAILPEYRSQHYGELLMRSMLAHAKLNGANSMTLEVRKSNFQAQGLYKKLGFVEKGVRKNYYSEMKEDALIMWCNL